MESLMKCLTRESTLFVKITQARSVKLRPNEWKSNIKFRMITRIRPYEPDDFQQVEELDHSVFPEYTGNPPWRAGWHFEAPESCAARYVAVDPSSGRLNGYGSVRHVGSRHYRANLMVHPSCRGSGIGGGLFSALWEQLAGPLRTAYLQVRVRKDQSQGLAFARSRDFEYIHVMRGRIARPGSRRPAWVGVAGAPV